MTRERMNEIGGVILDSSITVHRELGPGLLESAYQIALKKNLNQEDYLYKQKFLLSLFIKMKN